MQKNTTPKDTFLEWLRPLGKWRNWLLYGWVAISPIIHGFGSSRSVQSFLPPAISNFLSERLELIPTALHIITIVLLILMFLPGHMTFHDRQLRQLEGTRGQIAVKEIYKYWCLLWFVWGIFYIFLAIRFWSYPDLGHENTTTKYLCITIGDALNNLQTSILYLLYYKTTEDTLTEISPGKYRRNSKSPQTGLFITVAALSLLEYASLTLGVWPGFFSLISGCGAGISVALLAGRIDSKRISPPRLAVAALYLYAIIQPLYPFLGEKDYQYLGMAMFSLALLLKVLLFLVVYWMFDTGRLLYYCVRITDLIKHGDSDFREFLEELRTKKAKVTQQSEDISLDKALAKNKKESTVVKVFIGLPMSSAKESVLSSVTDAALEVVAVLEKKNVTVYCAATLKPPWEPADVALVRTEK